MALTEHERRALRQMPEDEYKTARARAMQARTRGYQGISAAQVAATAVVYVLLGAGVLQAAVWAAIAAPAALLVWRDADRRYCRSLVDDEPRAEPPPTPARRRQIMREAYAAATFSLVLASPTLVIALMSGGVLATGFALCALLSALLAVGQARGTVVLRDEVGYDYDGPELAAELAARSSMFTAFCASVAWFL